MRRIAVLFACLLTCTGALAASTLQPGDTPPDALGVTRDGTHLALSSMRGKVVVVSFWATWCGYCMRELPVLAGLQQVSVQRNLPLQVVAVNDEESRSTFVKAARMLHGRLPSLIVAWDRDGRIGRPYGTHEGIPVLALFHRDGTLAQLHAGYDERALDGIVAEINALLTEAATASPSVAVARAAH
ncbi:TlpA disulfide reductase family protein [Dyella sp.]|jgi:thiol-disulfide isomerase/thioredoxin|uniref:TlpA family protein disulfide reductase n=1 Tax=Dyella sp. TaxID=1869338 RepID=UPI002D78EBD3|nr:TlpA disulfide reductase family protein [Dyella sp.]HET6431016.1 TlpA disulfide reductase family protein [Dyella sp.]